MLLRDWHEFAAIPIHRSFRRSCRTREDRYLSLNLFTSLMKNQYFADINDYFKYGILRCLGKGGLRIAVCWMLTPDDGRSDGRKISYLSNPDRWRNYDPVLFD